MADGKLVLLNVPITSNPSFRFKMINKNSRNSFIGCCSKSFAGKTRFNLVTNSEVKENYFLFETYINSNEQSRNKIKQNPRDYYDDRTIYLIEIKFDKKIRAMTVFVASNGIKAEIPIGNFTNIEDLYPCAYFDQIGDSVELVSPLKIAKSEIKFTLGTFQHSQFSIDNNVISLTHSVQAQFALIEDTFRLDKVYKFSVDGNMGYIVGLGVCSGTITRRNNFLFTTRNYYNGAFLFHAQTGASVHGEFAMGTYYPFHTKIMFFDKDELSLWYDHDYRILVLRNESWMISDSFPVKFSSEETWDLHICVLLNDDGQEISVKVV